MTLVIFLAAAPAVANSQQVEQPPAAVGQDTMQLDTVQATAFQRPVSPMGAFWRSFLIPGWGQAKLNRKLPGGVFIAFEGLALGMVLKTSHQLSYLERIGDPGAEAKKQQQEDWITLLVFNHLMSGLEAFVSAHLWDFPDDLEIRPVPGEYGARVSIPLRLP